MISEDNLLPRLHTLTLFTTFLFTYSFSVFSSFLLLHLFRQTRHSRASHTLLLFTDPYFFWFANQKKVFSRAQADYSLSFAHCHHLYKKYNCYRKNFSFFPKLKLDTQLWNFLLLVHYHPEHSPILIKKCDIKTSLQYKKKKINHSPKRYTH